MKITWTKLQYMHGQCSDETCPVCDKDSTLNSVNSWINKRLTVWQSGCKGPRPSPWWNVVENEKDSYQKLKGDLRQKGYYDD